MRYVQPYGVTDTDASYINGDPSVGRAGSIPPADAFEHPMREIVGMIEHSAMTPSGADLLQLTKAIRSQLVNYAVDTGVVNTVTVAYDPVIVAYFAGLMLRVKIAVTNTGPATINAGAGTVPIKRANGASLLANDLTQGQVVDLIYDGTNFQIVNFYGVSGPDTTVNNYAIDIPYAQDVGTVNAMVGNFSPAITALAAGDLVLVRVANTNTGNVTMQCNAMAAVSVRRVDSAQLVAGDIVVGEMALLAFDGTNFQVINQSAKYEQLAPSPVPPDPASPGIVWTAYGPALSFAENHRIQPWGYTGSWTILSSVAGTYGALGEYNGLGTMVTTMTQAESAQGYYDWWHLSDGNMFWDTAHGLPGVSLNAPSPPVVLPQAGTWITSNDASAYPTLIIGEFGPAIPLPGRDLWTYTRIA